MVLSVYFFPSLKAGVTILAKARILLFCRADWIRTSDPYVPNVVRYRAALLPVPSAVALAKADKTKFTFAKASVNTVGWTGFEPATSCTPCKCATGLRHHPNALFMSGLQN